MCTGRTAHKGSRGTALLFLDHGTRRGRGISVTPRPLFTPGKDLVPIVQEAGWAPGPVWTGAENLAPPGFDPRFLLLGKTWYPLHRRLGGPQGRSGQVRKISPPPGFDPRTVQPVASCYTDYATRPNIRRGAIIMLARQDMKVMESTSA